MTKKFLTAIKKAAHLSSLRGHNYYVLNDPDRETRRPRYVAIEQEHANNFYPILDDSEILALVYHDPIREEAYIDSSMGGVPEVITGLPPLYQWGEK